MLCSSLLWLMVWEARGEFSCPPYEQIRQPSVDPSRFSMPMIDGVGCSARLAGLKPLMRHRYLV